MPARTQPAPDPGSGGPSFFRGECVSVYAGCEVAPGLPAVSGDGLRVAVTDSGPDSPRDELILAVRVVDIAGGAVVAEMPVITWDDHERGADPGSGEFSSAVHSAILARIRAVDQVLSHDRYQPLMDLGITHEERAADQVPGLRAVFDGTQLRIIETEGDTGGRILWQRAVGPSAPFVRGDGETCGPFPVADIHVWVSRDPPVVVARVAYIGNDVCATEFPYLVWR